jgi:hypothetical protein
VNSQLVIFSAPFNFLPSVHSADCFGDPVKCRFICWIPDYMPQLSQPPLEQQEMIKTLQQARNSEFEFSQPFAETTDAVKKTSCFLSFFKSVNLD